ncbi:NF-kappa-B inhibitor cactus-like [Tubulanus polymorphus]|uniref:NF-kappa-B inhibitor cactus-like n=1 Tax=Tubulanus polymorphus TaxID=672921 RepID=UPI003DA3F2B7
MTIQHIMHGRRVRGKLTKNQLEEAACSDACRSAQDRGSNSAILNRSRRNDISLNVEEITESFLQNVNIRSDPRKESWPLSREFKESFESGKWPEGIDDMGYDTCSGSYSSDPSCDSGVDIRKVNSWLLTPAKPMKRIGNLNICPALLEKLQSDRLTIDFQTLELFLGDADLENKLHEAVMNSNIVEFRAIVNRAPKPYFLDAMTSAAHTALHLCAFAGQLEMARILREAGADVNLADRIGNTPLHYSVKNGDVCMVAELLRGFEKDAKDTAKLLNCFNDEGYTVGHLACLTGNVEIVRILVSYSMKTFNSRAKKSGQTALHMAIVRNDHEMVHILTNNGANSEIPDYCGNTPLLVAAQNRNNEMTMALVRAGADRSELEQGLYDMDIDS